jgi:hypothetical protein
MIKILHKFFFVILIAVQFSVGLQGQSNCSAQLKLAKQLFDSGQIEQIPSLLDSCLQKGFTAKEKITAYQLLIQTYLFDYNQSKADETMVRFLKDFPNYILSDNDAPEIKELYESFTVQPAWSFELLAGGNMSIIAPKQYFTTFNYQTFENKNTIGFGYNVGLQATKYFGKHFAASVGAKYVGSEYQNSENNKDGTVNTEIVEKTSWITVPIMGYYFYNLKKSNFIPFIFCGAELGILSNSQADLSVRFSGNTPPNKGSGIDLTETRNKTNIWISSGIGLKYRLSRGSIKCWAGFNYSLNTFVKKESRYQNMDNILNYQHIDDDFLYNHIFINVSYSFDLYNIIKK